MCLGIVTPGGDAFKWLTCGFQLVGGEVPIRVANIDADNHQFGLGYGGEPSYYFGEHYGLVVNTGAKAVVQCGKTDGLRDGTNVQ